MLNGGGFRAFHRAVKGVSISGTITRARLWSMITDRPWIATAVILPPRHSCSSTNRRWGPTASVQSLVRASVSFSAFRFRMSPRCRVSVLFSPFCFGWRAACGSRYSHRFRQPRERLINRRGKSSSFYGKFYSRIRSDARHFVCAYHRKIKGGILAWLRFARRITTEKLFALSYVSDFALDL